MAGGTPALHDLRASIRRPLKNTLRFEPPSPPAPLPQAGEERLEERFLAAGGCRAQSRAGVEAMDPGHDGPRPVLALCAVCPPRS